MSSKKSGVRLGNWKNVYEIVALTIALWGVYFIVDPSLPHTEVLGIKSLVRGPEGGMPQQASDKGSQNSETKGSQQFDIQISKQQSVQVQSTGRGNAIFIREQSGQEASGTGRPGLGNISQATDGGSMKHYGAISHFPIFINPVTNEMTITTPAGTRVVAVLPDQAVQNMLTKGIISKIGGHIATGSGDLGGDDASSGSAFIQSGSSLAESNDDIELTEENGTPVYKIRGVKEKKLFGFFPVSIDKTLTVSVSSGEVESTQIPLFDRLLDAVSF